MPTKYVTKAARIAAVQATVQLLKPKTPFSDVELDILAAIFARSNMGMGLPLEKEVTSAKVGYQMTGKGRTVHLSLQQAVIRFCQHFMERDEDEDGFVQEAQMWKDILTKDGKEETCRFHPDICELYFGKDDPHVRLGRHEQANRKALQMKRQRRGRGK